MSLKLLLISVDGTLCRNGKLNQAIVKNVARLVQELAQSGVRAALWSNQKWTFAGVPLGQYSSNLCGFDVKVHGISNDGCPNRTQRNSADRILQSYGVTRQETLLVGSSENDVRAGVNNKLLLIRADWYGQQVDYGFRVTTVSELARFCFVFATRAHPIFWKLTTPSGVDMSAGGPFSTMIPAYAAFGGDARAFAKHGAGHPDFWFQFTISSLYFSGLLDGVHYICSFPSHNPANAVADERGIGDALMRLGQCFQISYYEDLLVRHTLAQKNQPIRAHLRTFANQLHTIRLNRRPTRNRCGQPNKTDLSLRGKMVLIVDDFCTSGRSVEAARAYIQAAGGTVRIYAWLKTINTSYQEMAAIGGLKPYGPNLNRGEPPSIPHNYYAGILDQQAPQEIDNIFNRYTGWNWP